MQIGQNLLAGSRREKMKNDYEGDMREKNIAFLFDGNVCSFKSEIKNPADIQGELIPGVPELFKKLCSAGFEITVYSERAASLAGRKAIVNWLAKNKLIEYVATVTSNVPIARCHVDNRAILYNGDVQTTFWRIINFSIGGRI